VVLLNVGRTLERVLCLTGNRRQVHAADVDKAGGDAILQPEQSIRRFQVSAAGNLRVRKNDIRRIESQKSLTSQPVGMVVKDTVTAADYRFRRNGVGKPDTRREIVSVLMDERFLEQISTFRRHERSGSAIEIRPFEILFARRCGGLIPEAQIQ